MWDDWLSQLLAWLSLPEFGLSTVFLVSFLSATLLPMGSEPAVFGMVQLRPELFWAVMLVATIGNTLGGCLNWWMGYGIHKAVDRRRKNQKEKEHNPKALALLERFGAKACFLSFLPIVGDPLCLVAGWLKLPFWQCTMWMAIGKFIRYVVLTIMLSGLATAWQTYF